MTTTTTPGPWAAIGTDVKTPGNNSRVICWTGQPEIPLDQARANARLIAAAPDMARVLRDLLAIHIVSDLTLGDRAREILRAIDGDTNP